MFAKAFNLQAWPGMVPTTYSIVLIKRWYYVEVEGGKGSWHGSEYSISYGSVDGSIAVIWAVIL